MFKLYKEGQGSKTRGFLAILIGLIGVFSAVRLYDFMGGSGPAQDSYWTIPFFNWSVNTASIVAVIVLAVIAGIGFWLFNHPKLSDFLIETETELFTKVTWPTKKVALSNSAVVVITTVLMAVWIMVCDVSFDKLKTIFYGIG